jgi:polysaccharide biosynthesis transport protein
MTEENKIQLYRDGVLSRIRKFSAVAGNSGLPDQDGEIDFHYVLRVLRDRYRTVLAATVAAALLALVASLFMKPTYRSQATIEIREATPDIESLQQLQSRNAAPNNVVVTEVETEIGILKSDTLARQVIDQVILAKQPKSTFSLSGTLSGAWNAMAHWYTGSDAEASPGVGISPSDVAGSGITDPGSAATHSPESEMDAKAYQRLVDRFEASLNVSRVGSSRLVKISYDCGDPRVAARVVNALVSGYLQEHQKSTKRLTKELSQQVDEAKNELEQSEKKMTEYARRNGLLYLQTDNGASSQNIVDQRLLQIQQQLTQAQADRYQKESVYHLVQKGDYGSLPGVFQDKLLQDLTVQVADLKRQYAQLSATFTDSYPKVKQVKSQLEALEKVLERERERAAANITDDYLASVRRETLLLQAYQQQKNAATVVAEKSTQYNMLKRSTDSDNQLYDNLLQKVKEASLVVRIKADNVDVVDRAVPQFLPVKPRILVNLALGLVVGLGLGIGLAFLQAHFDTTLRTVEEVDRFLGLPALAMIPAISSLKELVVDGNNDNGHGLLLPDVFDTSEMTKAETPWYRIDKQVHQKYSPLIEAFRTLGSSVMLEAVGRKKLLRSIVITSSQPGEGKTTVSVNLAIALAQQGSRVILVDADLRRPAVHRALGFRNIRGVSGYLGGLSEWAPCVLPGLSPGLDTLPAGRSAKNPVALLSSSRMKVMISQMLEEYDYLIIDSPALMPNLMDARILAGLVDGSIMVVRSGMAPREFVIRARRQLSNVVGVVLNSMDVRSMEDYYGYHSYGYGGGDGEDEPGRSAYEKRIARL